MWELVLAVTQARARIGHFVRAEDCDLPRVWSLIPAWGDFPDFLTPAAGGEGFEAGLEAIAATGRRRVVGDLLRTYADRPAPDWTRVWVNGDRSQLTGLIRGLRSAHARLVEPEWSTIQEAVSADGGRQVQAVAAKGLGAVLARLPGVLGWDGTRLHTRYPANQTLNLDGRGLLLQPSYFCESNPITFIDADLQPILVYPAEHQDPLTRTRHEVSPGLRELLGPTRAACLAALRSPCTTTELAGRVTLSLGAASKNASALRRGGLVVTVRRGPAVLHSLTPLGVALLNGAVER